MPSYLTATANIIAIGLLTLCLSGCREGDADIGTRALGERSLATSEHASNGVYTMLYERNLISNAEVNQKMREAVLRIARDETSRDSVIPGFYSWLSDWVITHPEQVEVARLASGGYTAEARQWYVDTDSSRKAQIDSIRRLVRDRAMRRIETARAASGS